MFSNYTGLLSSRGVVQKLSDLPATVSICRGNSSSEESLPLVTIYTACTIFLCEAVFFNLRVFIYIGCTPLFLLWQALSIWPFFPQTWHSSSLHQHSQAGWPCLPQQEHGLAAALVLCTYFQYLPSCSTQLLCLLGCHCHFHSGQS